MDPLNDETGAVRRLKAGDIDGLECLVRLHQARALRVAMAITRDLDDAEDIVAQAFLTAYERIGGFDDDRPFGPWFIRIVLNSALKSVRRSAVLGRVAPWLAQAGASGDPAQMAEEHELQAAVMEAVARLSVKLRATVALRYLLEMDVSEVAAVMNCPEGTVKRRLHDARLQLRGLLVRRFPELLDPTLEVR
jgi:RNA polymerase sigma-70 factor (ECF subfamily)